MDALPEEFTAISDSDGCPHGSRDGCLDGRDGRHDGRRDSRQDGHGDGRQDGRPDKLHTAYKELRTAYGHETPARFYSSKIYPVETEAASVSTEHKLFQCHIA